MIKLFSVVTFYFAAIAAREADAQSAHLLFILERSKNVNQVCYEARITPNGLLDPVDPVHVYWINWVKDPTGKTREELSLIEKNIVYGCKFENDVEGEYISLTIVSYPDRAFTISMKNEKAVAKTVIDGTDSYLDKIYIDYRETRMFPKVNYIELFGRAVKTGEPRYEKIALK